MCLRTTAGAYRRFIYITLLLCETHSHVLDYLLETIQTHNGSQFLLSSPFYTIIPKGKVGVITDHTKGLRTINNSHECWDCLWGWWSHAFSSHFLDQSWPTVAALLAPSAPDSLKQPPAFVLHCFFNEPTDSSSLSTSSFSSTTSDAWWQTQRPWKPACENCCA